MKSGIKNQRGCLAILPGQLTTYKGVGLETVSTSRFGRQRQVHGRVAVSVEFRPVTEILSVLEFRSKIRLCCNVPLDPIGCDDANAKDNE